MGSLGSCEVNLFVEPWEWALGVMVLTAQATGGKAFIGKILDVGGKRLGIQTGISNG